MIENKDFDEITTQEALKSQMILVCGPNMMGENAVTLPIEETKNADVIQNWRQLG